MLQAKNMFKWFFFIEASSVFKNVSFFLFWKYSFQSSHKSSKNLIHFSVKSKLYIFVKFFSQIELFLASEIGSFC